MNVKMMRDFADDAEHEDYEVEVKNLIEDSKFNWSIDQSKYIASLQASGDTACIPYLRPKMSVKMFEIVHQSAKLGPEYAEQISSVDFTEDEAAVVLYGYTKEFNIFEQMKEGEDPENLRMLIDLVQIPDIDLSEFFDEEGAYVKYDLVRKRIEQERNGNILHN